MGLSKLRFVVDGAGRAFAAVLDATHGLPAIAETTRYFANNANSAARRAAQISIANSTDD